jgi:antitoxin VapB
MEENAYPSSIHPFLEEPVPLNIEHPDADRLARTLAQATGETLTDAVLNALRERLQRETGRSDPSALREDLRRIQRSFVATRRTDPRGADETIGYDEHGLPG